MALGTKSVGPTGRVHAVEANPLLLPYLMRSLYWAPYPEVIRLYNRAASDEDGQTVSIQFEPQYIGGGSVVASDGHAEAMDKNLAQSLWENVDAAQFVKPDGSVTPTSGGNYLSRQCTTARLDTLLKDTSRVDLLHMDIEGSEPAAIAGGQAIIKRSPGIAVIMEWSPLYCLAPERIEQSRAMWAFFETLGYSWYRIRYEDFSPWLPVPRLSRIHSREALFALKHSDVLLVKDLRKHFRWWPALVIDDDPDRIPLRRSWKARWKNLRGLAKPT
jgi:FkbM family methyltransferase